jgi:aerobic-type carbon monoxide dehydrogenase small subunit (CoxS/CutS family)
MAQYSIDVNGRMHQIEGEAGDSLLSLLRYELGLTGSKYGCGEGRCGACTVLVDGRATRSCVAHIGALSGRKITTIEGLASSDGLHPVQAAFLETEAFQCGYCTPGMVMQAVSLLATNPTPTQQDIVTAMDGNVCRCGTFPRIVKAVQLAAQRIASAPSAKAGR